MDAMEKFAESMFSSMQRYVDAKIKAALEQMPFAYLGPWEEGKQYEPGNFVSHGGGVWHCNVKTSTKPGGGNPMWTLAVKAGRDGKDAA